MSVVIERDIEVLPAKMKEVLALRLKSHLSNPEIAEQLGISEKTIRNQVQNALKILRSKLGVLGYFIFIFYKIGSAVCWSRVSSPLGSCQNRVVKPVYACVIPTIGGIYTRAGVSVV